MAAARKRDEPGRKGPGTDPRTSEPMSGTCEVPHRGRRVGAGAEHAGAGERSVAPAAQKTPSGSEPAGRRHRRGLHWPHRRHKKSAAEQTAPQARYGRNGQLVPTGLGASLATSGGMLLAMVEDVRMRGGVGPEDLRPLADTFARHVAAKEATVRKVLIRHDVATTVVERDRQEGELIQDILDRALMGRHPEDTRNLTVDGALTQMYQYLSHERRDLVPAIDRAISPEDSESLAAAFEAISDPQAAPVGPERTPGPAGARRSEG
jgi:hypothetical protein